MTDVDESARTWALLNLHDRVHEALAAKIEGNMNSLPGKGMFVCADVQALLAEVLELRAALARHQSAALARLGDPA